MGAAAAVVGGASLVSGVLGSKAAGKAADAQAAASRTAQQEEARQFDVTQKQLKPFRKAGVSALEQQQALLGLGGEEEQQAAFAAFGESPGQKFLRDQQERSLLRNASAIGGLGGGNVRSALQSQAFGRAQTDFADQFNRLAGLSEAGRAATERTGQFGAQAASNIGGLQQQAGAARASGILGKQQALSGGIQNLAGAFGQFGGGGLGSGPSTSVSGPRFSPNTLSTTSPFVPGIGQF